ncbi:hypothetical protein OAK65_03805 [Synechococcus sp. AH-551-N17]|nr:hypothetical protein [Synechococcus sp. AH-551-N17]
MTEQGLTYGEQQARRKTFLEAQTSLSGWTITASLLMYVSVIGIAAAPFVMLAQTGTWRGFFLLPIAITWLSFCSFWAIGGLLNPGTLVMLALSILLYVSGQAPTWFNYILILYTGAHYINHHTVEPLKKGVAQLAAQAFPDGVK